MMTRFCQAIFGFVFVVSIASFGCQVGFKDLQSEETFQCDEDSDCIDGYVCDESAGGGGGPDAGQSGSGLCVEACSGDADCSDGNVCVDQVCVTACIDKDDDGYGGPESADLSLCSACTTGKKNGCQEDCKDGNPAIHPGAVENCDEVDNNCDGKVDEPVPCESNSDCNLSGPGDRPNTSVLCERESNQGQNGRECVLKGANRQSPKCSQAKATCEDGSWGSLPEECTSF